MKVIMTSSAYIILSVKSAARMTSATNPKTRDRECNDVVSLAPDKVSLSCSPCDL
jgi:hypothetical protein